MTGPPSSRRRRTDRRRTTPERRRTDRRAGERRRGDRRAVERRTMWCAICQTQLTPSGYCPTCQVRVVRLRL
ncbi:MAG: hypothetical protein HY208_02195 [Nitrospirae bacterium]|nr:hypothetical protein [Nitrospirota bacterium]